MNASKAIQNRKTWRRLAATTAAAVSVRKTGRWILRKTVAPSSSES